MAKLITLTGASGSGKSEAITRFLSLAKGQFKPSAVAKHTTRPARLDDNVREVITTDRLPEELDLVYQQYDARYGTSSTQLADLLNSGISPILVLNDVRTISEVRAIFGGFVRSIYVYRSAPSRSEFERVARDRGESPENNVQLEKRLKKAEAIFRIYIENIDLFDHVILNTRGFEQMEQQVDAIVRDLVEESERLITSGVFKRA